MMNLRNFVSFEVDKDDRRYVFLIPAGAKYDEAHAVAQEFAAGVLELQRINIEKAKEQESQKSAPNEGETCQ